MWASSSKHLAEAGETYLEHFRFALTVGLLTMGAGLACVIHAIVSALCQRTCSRTVAQLQALFGSRGLRREVQRQASGIFTFLALLILAASVVVQAALSGAPAGLVGVIASLALCFPAAFLLTNRDLEAVQD